MNEDIKNKFFEYEELKIKEKQIKARLEELKVDLIEVIPDDTPIEARHGKFVKKTKMTWVYSPDTIRMEDELKERQKEEKQTGDAEEVVSSVFIEYRENR